MATRIVPKTELRERIRSELAALGDDTLLITERGRPLAVAVAVERWNAVQEELEELQDRIAVVEERRSGDRGRAAEEALSEIETGEADVRGPARAAG